MVDLGCFTLSNVTEAPCAGALDSFLTGSQVSQMVRRAVAKWVSGKTPESASDVPLVAPDHGPNRPIAADGRIGVRPWRHGMPVPRRAMTARGDRGERGRIGNADHRLPALAPPDVLRALPGASCVPPLVPDLAECPINHLFKRIETTFAAAAREKGLRLRVVPSSTWVRSGIGPHDHGGRHRVQDKEDQDRGRTAGRSRGDRCGERTGVAKINTAYLSMFAVVTEVTSSS